MRRFALAVDLGGTKIAAACVDLIGRVTHRRVVPTPREGGESVVSAIVDLLRQLPCNNASAIGIDVPGLAYGNGDVWAPNIAGWERMPLGAAIRAKFDIPVLIESDRNASVIGEAWLGAARGCHDVIFLAIGTGIGAGIISGDRLIRGSAELAGSFGWMAVGPHFLPEYKQVGCLESHLAGPGIAKRASRTRKVPITTHELIQLARQGDPAATKSFAQAGEYLGLALANMVSMLNPEMVVIGGGIAAAGNLLLAPARETMQKWAQPLASKQVKVVRSRLGGRAALLGMARMGFDATLDSSRGKQSAARDE